MLNGNHKVKANFVRWGGISFLSFYNRSIRKSATEWLPTCQKGWFY